MSMDDVHIEIVLEAPKANMVEVAGFLFDCSCAGDLHLLDAILSPGDLWATEVVGVWT